METAGHALLVKAQSVRGGRLLRCGRSGLRRGLGGGRVGIIGDRPAAAFSRACGARRLISLARRRSRRQVSQAMAWASLSFVEIFRRPFGDVLGFKVFEGGAGLLPRAW